MGTSYKLTTNATKQIEDEINKHIEDQDLREDYEALDPLSEGIGWWGEHFSRWDADVEVKKLSLIFPNVVMILDEQNEEGTLYRNYYYNGMSHNSNIEIVYSKFDKELLK